MTRFLRLLALLACAAPVSGVAQQRTDTVIVADARRANVARDTAISRLEDFLERYPNSTLRANALFQLGELLVREADERFAQTQRASSGDSSRADTPIRPNYGPAIARYEELVRRYPDYDRVDAAAYTLGTLYAAERRFTDAVRLFGTVAAQPESRFRGEAFFRQGDAYFELAAQERGAPRRALFAQAARAYEQATSIAPRDGDIYFLALYKLGWSYYNQATQANEETYRQAVDVFGRLVAAYDQLSPERQSRLGLRGEAIEYMAVAFTQVGGAEAANRYFETQGGGDYKIAVLRRVAQGLRDQGDFTRAVEGYQVLLREAPNDSTALSVQREIVDIYQNRMLEPEQAQRARLELVERFGPGSAWAQANPSLAAEAGTAREEALRQGGQYVLAAAQQGGNRERFAEAAALYQRYMTEFASSDSAQVVNRYYAEALFGQNEFARAGAEFNRTAYAYRDTGSTFAQEAGRNAIVAYDSALVRNKTDRAIQDSLFATVDRFVAAFGDTDLAKKALVQKGRRASETERWEVLAETFRTYAQRYPDDPYTPTAQKLVGDALYKQGRYAEAQAQWEQAQTIAVRSGRRALADSIGTLRTQAASSFADTLVKQGEFARAAEEVYVTFAEKNPESPRAPGALRDAIETYMLADSAARARGDEERSRTARRRAIELSNRLVTKYPNYQYRVTYQALAARLLAETGERDQAVEALRTLIAQNPRFEGRADAMVQLAVTLDSLGRDRESAAAYEQFAAAYPRDPRAADAQYNAAVTYVEAGDSTAAARAYGTFVQRFPRDERATQARQLRVGLLQASGDTTAARVELTRLCGGNVSAELRAVCAERNAERFFRAGVARFAEYQSLQLVISSPRQLTRAGVERASAQKQRMLRQMTQQFSEAIETGNPEFLAASTFYVGLAQWEYGNFLKNVQLPNGLTEAQRTQAQEGAAQQAEQYYEAARKTWQTLVDKASQEPALADDPKAAPWIERARAAIGGNVPETPPTSSAPGTESPVAGGQD